MDKAKHLAQGMLNAINLQDGILVSYVKGFISFPVDMYYLAFEYLDTDHRFRNMNDRIRLMELVKRGMVNRSTFEKMIRLFIKEFISKIDIEHIKKYTSELLASTLGKMTFNEITGIKLGQIISSRLIASASSGFFIGSTLALGGETSRAIYASERLKNTDYGIYEKLRRMGDLDMLYFLIEDLVKPYMDASNMAKADPGEFNRLCEFFFGGITIH